MGSPIPEPRQRSRLFRSHSESSDEVSELDLSHGKKDAFVLEVCRAEDLRTCLLSFRFKTAIIRSVSHRLTTPTLWRTSTLSSPMRLHLQVSSSHFYSTCIINIIPPDTVKAFNRIHFSLLQVSTAATQRLCLGFITGLQQYRCNCSLNILTDTSG